ncbi:MAG: transcription elongation factor GreA [Ignavibacteria bacterium]|nr:MAG: transcription elongation factor GreA [Ignavibacteria bacterium]
MYPKKIGRNKLSNFVYLSKERLHELEKELNDLKTRGRKEMAERIAEARSHGDLSENAEYDAAKDAQGLLELKINKLEQMLSKAKVIDKSAIPEGEVGILSTVTVKNLKVNKTFKYTIVAPEEANLSEGKISFESPVGKALLGAKKGETVDAQVPAGVIKFEIIDVE